MRMAGTIRRTIIGQGFILVALMFDLETLWRDANEVIYYSTSASLRRTRERDIVACFFFHPTSSSACMSSKQERAKEQSLDEMRSTSFMTQLSHSLSFCGNFYHSTICSACACCRERKYSCRTSPAFPNLI